MNMYDELYIELTKSGQLIRYTVCGGGEIPRNEISIIDYKYKGCIYQVIKLNNKIMGIEQIKK